MASLLIVPTFESLFPPPSSCQCLSSTRYGPVKHRALFRRRWSPFEASRLSRFLDLAEDEREFSGHTEGLENLRRLPSLLLHLRDRRSAEKNGGSATNKCSETGKRASGKVEQKISSQDGRRSDKFNVSLELGDAFEPSEISVKVVGKSLKIEGKHEEIGDDGHFSCRKFMRSFYIPDDVDMKNLTSALSREGVLSVEAPRLQLNENESVERNIPIQQTTSHEAVEEKKSEEINKNEDKKTNSQEEEKEMELIENKTDHPKETENSSRN